MNTNRPSDRIEQNFRFLFPIEFLELNIQRSYKSTQHKVNAAREREKTKKWNFLKWVISTYLKHIAVSRLQTPNNVHTFKLHKRIENKRGVRVCACGAMSNKN